jgi:hypothetical protein
MEKKIRQKKIEKMSGHTGEERIDEEICRERGISHGWYSHPRQKVVSGLKDIANNCLKTAFGCPSLTGTKVRGRSQPFSSHVDEKSFVPAPKFN